MATKMTQLVPLEQEFADMHHGEIERFLNVKGLDGSYYHVVVMAYLSAVEDYLRTPALREKVPFQAVAWRRMKFAVLDEYRAQSRLRKRIVKSIDTMMAQDEGAWSMEGVLGREDSDMEMVVLLDALRSQLDAKQMAIVDHKLNGLTNREIAKGMQLTGRELEEQLTRIYGAVKETCCA